MTELLAPAGNMDALIAAISNGCDAVYLGMQKFGARAYSSNFCEETLKEAVDYAHLRGVKIYVTMNTIVFEDEIEDMKKQLDLINLLGVDGVIVQDIAVFNYIVENFEDMEAHCSTQMGLDDLDGTLLWKEKGAKRVVLARELPIEKVKEIKNAAKIPVEIFVHGALCVSYSGNCLMSGLIGYRSGNRGRCVGSCRKPYELINSTTNKSIGSSYLLSTKDLNTFDHIEELKEIDSLKIEGRMKEPYYVANVVDKYRKALDGRSEPQDSDELYKTFNRTYTCGYLFGEDKKNITNTHRPNNFGYEIGYISGFHKGKYEITLSQPLNQNDIIRIDRGSQDINTSVVKLYDKDGLLINSADKKAYIKLQEQLKIGDKVYKTKDYHYYKNLENQLDKEFKRFPLNLNIYAYPNAHLVISAEGLGCSYLYEGDEILNSAITNPTTKEQVVKQLSKLKDTIFYVGDVEFEECNAFIPVKLLNNARREIVQGLYAKKLQQHKKRRKNDVPKKEAITFPRKEPYLTAVVNTQEQYDTCVKAGIKNIYFKNIIRRNQNDYPNYDGKTELLIGGYGGLHHYRNRNNFVTDYSMNAVNSESCYELHRLGAKRVTLSYELNKTQLKALVDSYFEKNGGYPALEMIVYGRAPLMFTKYCPLKKMEQCEICRKNRYEIRDEYGSFPVINHSDCTTTILNGKILNLLDDMPSIKGIEAFRLNFTLESGDEVSKIIKNAQDKLKGSVTKSLFNQETDTRGHFNKEII